MCIIATGDAFHGITCYGPFENEATALDFADANICDIDWYIVPLQSPAALQGEAS